MNIDKMIKEILDERILNDGLTAKGWKKYNDGITKAVQVIREYQANDVDTSTYPALPIQSVMERVSDELLLRAGKYEDEANADIDTDGVRHNLNIGRYDGLMLAVQELNKHLQ